MNQPPASQEPDCRSVYDYLVYGLSLPERTLRSTSAMIGGAIRETTELVVPQAFKTSRSYTVFIGQMLDFLAKDVGGVQRPSDEQGDDKTKQIESFVARKAVGNFLELAGLAAVHVSPLVVLAVFSDIAYGSKAYLNELSAELKREGIIDQSATITNSAELLDAVGKVSETTSEAFNLPPLSVEGLKETIEQTRTAVKGIDPAKLIPQDEIDRLWLDMRQMATRENLNLFQFSSAVTLYTLNRMATIGKTALSTVRVAGNMMDQHIFDHYRNSLEAFAKEGFYKTVARVSEPHFAAVWNNFSFERHTITEDVVSGKMAGRVWDGLRGWFTSKTDGPNQDNAIEIIEPFE